MVLCLIANWDMSFMYIGKDTDFISILDIVGFYIFNYETKRGIVSK